jgi:hypothetical protein
MNYLPCLLQTTIFLISASWVAQVTEMSHWHLAVFCYYFLSFFPSFPPSLVSSTSSLYILTTIPCQMYSWQTFFHFVGCLLIRWPFLLLYRSFLISCSPICQCFPRCWAFWVLFRKLLPMPISSSIFPALSCTSFKFSGLLLKSFNQFELILVQVKDMM